MTLLKYILKRRLLLWLFLLLPLLPSAPCNAADYRITGTGLTRLEQVLKTQETALIKALTLLDGQGKELSGLQAELQTALTELEQSRLEIQTLRDSLNTALTSIDKANQSFEAYAKEMKRKVRAAKMQRNLWAALAVALSVAVRK